ncbi:hypothetical protein CBL_14491 [Carabus blaptoides fortunei]
MSRLVKKLVDMLRGGDERNERNDSAAPLKNRGASARHRSLPNLSTSFKRTTSRNRRSKLSRTVTLEQMKKDGVFQFCNAGCLSAVDIWGHRMIPTRTVATQDSQINTDANLTPCTTNETGPRLSNIGRRNSDTERKRELDDWDDIPCLSLEEIMSDLVIPENEPDHVSSTHDLPIDTAAALPSCSLNKTNESNWSIWRRNNPLTDCGFPRKRKLPDAFGDWDDLSRASTKQQDTTAEQADHTISTSRARVDTSADTLFTTTAEQSQTSPRIPRPKKWRATRRNGRKRPRTQ